MRNIDVHIPPMEMFCIWENGFSITDCDKIIEIGELFEFQQARVGESNQARLDTNIRETNITWIQPEEDYKWIFERMNELAAKINFDKYQMNLNRFDGFQYSKYDINGHYDWHIDTILAPRDGLYRKLSFSLMLTDPDDYTGGELLMNDKGNQDNPTSLRPKKGDLVCFYSHVPHKVSKIISGTRTTLVTWGLGSKIV